MIVNKKRKWRSKIVSLSIATALLATGGAVSAASKTAYLDGSGTSKNTGTVTATSNNVGDILTQNSGANTNVRGYGKKKITLLPDSTVASSPWLGPNGRDTRFFGQDKNSVYYGQITGQTKASRGNISIAIPSRY